MILGIETSCDETSAAVLDGDAEILGHVIFSQDQHAVFGGVVPELAARAHLKKLDEVVEGALRQADARLPDLDAVAVTTGPGLIGALLVGVSWAKAVAYSLDRPLVPVHHMEAHLFGPILEDPAARPPFIALLVSGGHTLLLHVEEWGRYRYLGGTRDDAAGEAFDKVAKLLGLPYPGGAPLEKLAGEGDGSRFELPRPMLGRGRTVEDDGYYDFSFSGLKTAVVNLVKEIEGSGAAPVGSAGAENGPTGMAGSALGRQERADVAASFQEAAVDVLASKTLQAVDQMGCRRVLVGGGVAANGRLSEELSSRLGPGGSLFRASPRLSLDNGAMVARAGAFRLERGDVADPAVTARADLPFPGLFTESGREPTPSLTR